MKRVGLGIALLFMASAAQAEWELRPTPDSGYGPLKRYWIIDTTGQERTQVCEFFRASYSYQTGVNDELTVTLERTGALESRLHRCLVARFRDE